MDRTSWYTLISFSYFTHLGSALSFLGCFFILFVFVTYSALRHKLITVSATYMPYAFAERQVYSIALHFVTFLQVLYLALSNLIWSGSDLG